jgi:asparagine synthase (glutamine-hydrolysing)
MCGIYGFIGDNNLDIVEKKLSKINYRGPNYSSIYNKVENVFLGHNRLAILDLDSRSNQPFEYEHLVIVFNGEIYNYLDIRKSLMSKFNFKTNSDTEVILASYLEYGEDCVNEFNGMFSFVIYDKKNNILFGARDRIGKKPFFYRTVGKTFEFASQISPLLIGLKKDINWINVQEYFFWGYNQSPNTFHKEIFTLGPGCKFKYNIDTGKLFISKYWGLNPNLNSTSKLTLNESVDLLDSLLTDAVKIRNIADVPIGVFLSGGIDSSLIAALAQKTTNTQISTFSIGFQEDNYDESRYAKSVSDHLNTNHHTFFCTKGEVQNFIVNIDRFIDQPLSDPSYIPTLLLTQNTASKVTVALSGDGGDEFFLGYNRYKWLKNTSYLPYIFKKGVAKVLSRSSNYRHKILAEGLKINNDYELYCKMVGNIKPGWLNLGYDHNELIKFWDNELTLVSKMGHFDVNTYLLGDINTKVDLASMRFSLETRAPLLDYRVCEFANTLPEKYKYSHSNQKLLLKKLLYKYVPSNYFDRPKSGFAMPLKEWFRTDLKEFVLDTLTNNELKKVPFLNSEVFSKMIKNHMSGLENNSLEIWKTIVWLKLYNNFE